MVCHNRCRWLARQYQIGSDEDDVYGSGIPVHTEQKEFHVVQP